MLIAIRLHHEKIIEIQWFWNSKKKCIIYLLRTNLSSPLFYKIKYNLTLYHINIVQNSDDEK